MGSADTAFNVCCPMVCLKHVFTLIRALKQLSDPAVTTAGDVRTIFKIVTVSEKVPSKLFSLKKE
jgi:hypothetical protein